MLIQSIFDKIKDLPDPTGAVIIVGGFLGVPVVLLTLVAIVHLFQGWIDAGRKAASVSRKVPGALRRVAQMPRVRILLAITVTILVLLAQALTLVTCFTVGTVISWIFYHDQFHETMLIFHRPAYSFGSTPQLSEALKINYVSGAYIFLGAWTLLRAYRHAFKRISLEGVSLPLTAPAYLWLYGAYALALFGSIPAVLGIISGEWKESLGGVAAAAGMAVIGFLYIAACEGGVRAAGLLVQVWAPPRTGLGDFYFDSAFGHPLRRPWSR